MSKLIAGGDFPTAVALGHVPGWESFRKFGTNDAVASGTEEMWPVGASRVLPSAAGVATVVSSSDADDAVGGTGALALTVEGLDTNYKEVSESFTMDGQVNVVGTVEFLRINRAFITSSGTGQTNAGNISVSVGGDLQAYVEANEGQTHQTHYTVPFNKTLIVTSFEINVGRMANADLHVQSEIMLFGTNSWRAVSNIYLFNGSRWTNDSSRTVIPSKTEIRQEIITTTTTQCSGVFSGYLALNGRLDP